MTSTVNVPGKCVGDDSYANGWNKCREAYLPLLAGRDARIAELEADRDSHQRCAIQAMAELAAIKAQDTVGEVVGWYRLDQPYEMTSYPSVCATWHKLGAPVAPLYAAPAAPSADASDVLDQAMYTLISIGYHENSGLVHELRQALAAHRAKGVV